MKLNTITTSSCNENCMNKAKELTKTKKREVKM